MNSPTKELIRLYAKQLKMPTFSQYEEVERQLEATAGYDVFLLELLKRELAERQSSSQKRRIKQAKFPVLKTMDEFDCNRCPNVEEAFLREAWLPAAVSGDGSIFLQKRNCPADCGGIQSGNCGDFL